VKIFQPVPVDGLVNSNIPTERKVACAREAGAGGSGNTSPAFIVFVTVTTEAIYGNAPG
jgi:hypothetical protein